MYKTYEKKVRINGQELLIDFHKTVFLERYLKKNKSKVLDFKTVIDIGSYDCQESLTFASLFPNATITAFECNPDNIWMCRDNIEKSDRIILVEKMVTDTSDNKLFYKCHPDLGGVSSMHRPIKKEILNYNIINVPSIRMDEYLDDSIIDLVWIDVQGAELNVLRSFGEKLKNVNTIYCEVDIVNNRYDSDSTLDTVSEFLYNNGYLLKDTMLLNSNEAHIIVEKDEKYS